MPSYNRIPTTREKIYGSLLLVLLGAQALAGCGDLASARALASATSTPTRTIAQVHYTPTVSQPQGCDGNTSTYGALVSNNTQFMRIDQGIDFIARTSDGFDICAPASGTITLADQTGHDYDNTDGHAEIVEKLDQKPDAPNSSPYVYFAELIQISPNIHVGTHVEAGEVIGHNNQTPGIEAGWAADPQGNYWLCAEGVPTPCGESFDQWVRSKQPTARSREQHQ